MELTVYMVRHFKRELPVALMNHLFGCRERRRIYHEGFSSYLSNRLHIKWMPSFTEISWQGNQIFAIYWSLLCLLTNKKKKIEVLHTYCCCLPRNSLISLFVINVPVSATVIQEVCFGLFGLIKLLKSHHLSLKNDLVIRLLEML